MNKENVSFHELIKKLQNRLLIIETIKENPEILQNLDKEDRFYFLSQIKDYKLYQSVFSEFYQIKLMVDIIRLGLDKK